IVCSRPATATTLEEEARSARVSDSPALARQVIDALARDLPRAASENTVWVEATFEKSGLGKKEEEITEALAQRLTQLEAGLLACGAGDTRRVDAASLVEMVRNSFDPAWPVSIPRDGSVSVEEMWREVGPVAYEEAWKSLHHDSAYSQSWEMSEAPRSAITSQSLFPLLSADKMIPRKRVALIFRPYSRARSQKVAESQTSTRVFDANSSRRKQVSPSARHDANVAQRAAEAVTLGASMVRFSVVVTISVDKAEDLDRASAIVREASGAVPVTIRPSYGSQAPAFATTLPIGFLPWHSGKIRTRLQEAAS
ncbi:MAG: hypothetical protein L0J79_02960, partial [Propionibacterium sp.]|nr:hypothetical protein [Propionibacterium sp.]